MLVTAAAVDVVMLEEHGGRQHDVGEPGGVRHELLVDAGEQVVAQHALPHQALLRRDIGRIGVLDEQRGHRRPAIQRLGVAGEDAADLRLVEVAHARIGIAAAFDPALVELEDVGIGMEGAAALILPGSR